MKNRVFIIHGWDGNPHKDWIPWAKSELENRGYDVIAPLMPDTANPRIEPWVNTLKKIVSVPREDDIFIGHSIGCQTILRYLADLPEGQKVDKVVMIAPWFTLTNLESDESWKIADPWFKTPIDLSKAKTKANSFTAIFSNNDSWVPLEENKKMFEKRLNPKIIVLHNKGHFSEEEGVSEIPEILDLL